MKSTSFSSCHHRSYNEATTHNESDDECSILFNREKLLYTKAGSTLLAPSSNATTNRDHKEIFLFNLNQRRDFAVEFLR